MVNLIPGPRLGLFEDMLLQHFGVTFFRVFYLVLFSLFLK